MGRSHLRLLMVGAAVAVALAPGTALVLLLALWTMRRRDIT